MRRESCCMAAGRWADTVRMLTPVDDEQGLEWEDRLRRHEMYVGYAKEARELQARSYESSDQAILTLSSAALAISMAVLAD